MSQKPLEIYAKNRELLTEYLYQWNLGKGAEALDLAYEAKDERLMVGIANELWWALPDRPAIREAGFFRLCDIAEFCFDDQLEDH